jgi:hypothetical protein
MGAIHGVGGAPIPFPALKTGHSFLRSNMRHFLFKSALHPLQPDTRAGDESPATL